jgi:hypothetical protein
MKSKILLATALASLLASAGIADAQGTNQDVHKGASSTAPSTRQAQSPSEHAQPGNHMGQSERGPSNNRMTNPSAQERNRMENPSAQDERNRMQNPSAQGERNRMERGPSTEDQRGAAENAPATQENRGASAQLSQEQRSRIRTSVFGERNAPRIAQNDINMNLTVGARIPRDRLRIRPLPLPETVVAIEPRWRGYDYFLVGNEIVVVEPGTFEIVAIIPA